MYAFSLTFYLQVFTRIALTCGNAVETQYYSAISAGAQIGRPDICCFCANEGATRNPELVRKYKTVLPMCEKCVEEGKEPVTHRERPTRSQ